MEVVNKTDIEIVRDKISSEEFFNAKESQKQIKNLFSRFLNANLFLKDCLPAIFKLKDGVNLISNDGLDNIKEKMAVLESKYAILVKEGWTEQTIDSWVKKVNNIKIEMDELIPGIDAINAHREKIVDDSKLLLEQVGDSAKKESSRFQNELKKLNKTVRWNIFGMYVLGFEIAILFDFFLKYLGVDEFSNILYTLTQISSVFLISEFVINYWMKKISKKIHQPNLFIALNSLDSDLNKYDSEIEQICIKSGIEYKFLFYELEKFYSEAKKKDILRRSLPS